MRNQGLTAVIVNTASLWGIILPHLDRVCTWELPIFGRKVFVLAPQTL
jgi:hypothetical protein